LDLGKIFLFLGDVEKKFINHEFSKCRFITIKQHWKEGDFLESWVVCQINCLDGSEKGCEVNIFKRTIICIQSAKVKIHERILSLSKGSVEKNELDNIIIPTDVEMSNCLWEGREINSIDLWLESLHFGDVQDFEILSDDKQLIEKRIVENADVASEI